MASAQGEWVAGVVVLSVLSVAVAMERAGEQVLGLRLVVSTLQPLQPLAFLTFTTAWTEGPWTSWWGTSGCPASTWTGWTEGSWSTEAPWTTWSGCQASTTASSVYTTTVTVSGSAMPSTATSYGIKLAQATSGSSSSNSDSNDNSDSGNDNTFDGAAGHNTAVVAAAIGMIGVAGAALLL